MKAWIKSQDVFIETNVIGEYANLLSGHRIEEQLKRMKTLEKLQNSKGAQQNGWKQPSISVLQNQSVLQNGFLVSLGANLFSKILPNLKKSILKITKLLRFVKNILSAKCLISFIFVVLFREVSLLTIFKKRKAW